MNANKKYKIKADKKYMMNVGKYLTASTKILLVVAMLVFVSITAISLFSPMKDKAGKCLLVNTGKNLINKINSELNAGKNLINKIPGKFLIASTSILIFIGLLLFVSFTTTSVFSFNTDWFNQTVTINNIGPTMSNLTMAFNDTVAGNDIQLTAASDGNLVYCNATASDVNGWQDIVTASAKIWHSSSLVGATDDKNVHYSAVNGTLGAGKCDILTGSGNDVNITCEVNLEHEATNGSWYCNISVADAGGLSISNVTNSSVTALVGLNIINQSIFYGSLSPNTNSSTLPVNITNEGNVQMGVNVNGTAMVCSVLGNIPLTNIKYSSTNIGYSSMTTALTGSAAQVAGFTLVPQGISPFPDNQNATLNTYWAIGLPVSGIKGTCVGNVTVTAIAV